MLKSKVGDSFVYIMKEMNNDDSHISFYKIGVATHGKTDEKIKHRSKYVDGLKSLDGQDVPIPVIRRLDKIKVGNPRTIEVLKVFKYENSKISLSIEKRIHTKLSKNEASHPEWFRMTDVDVKELIELLMEDKI